MKITTESGSQYEANTDSRKIRRLDGKRSPTSRIGKDGDWKSYKELLPNPPRVGCNLIIVWGDDVELLDETKQSGEPSIPTTLTSVVVSIEDIDWTQSEIAAHMSKL